MEIQLTQGKTAIIDEDDFERVSEFKWHYQKKSGYAAARPTYKGKSFYLHRFIMRAKKGEQVDHRNGNKLDNCKENLRFSTQSQNLANRSTVSKRWKYKGVRRLSTRGLWHARICYQKKDIHLGTFATEEEAARAYDKKALEVFGEFARLNFQE